jgi:hypothetical protein
VRRLTAITALLLVVLPACGAADDEPGDAVAAVVSAIEAKNRLDLEGWLAAHEGGARQGVPIFAEQILMNAQQQWEIVDPCHATGEDGSGGTSVECELKDINDFWGVGGISDTRFQLFWVNAEGLITNTNSFSSGNRDIFNQAFHQWLGDTYPGVDYGLGAISRSGPGFDTQDPDHMLIAVDYVEEFVGQSDVYPLDLGGG